MKSLTKNEFSIEGQKPFSGYYDPERDWNGWDCPYFEWAEAQKIVEWLNEWSGQIQLKIDNEKRAIVSVEDPESPFDITGLLIETDDGEKELYEIGTGWWIWSIHNTENSGKV